MKRVGIAFSHPRGETQRRDEYGIYRGEAGSLFAKYAGYREQSPTGEVWVGLPLAGPNACWRQPYIDFYPGGFKDVRFFKEKK